MRTTASIANAASDVVGSQEDIDLLIAFRERDVVHLILLEAKAETGWLNRQLRLKQDRFVRLFGERGDQFSNVTPHFVMWSLREPQQVLSDEWPGWMLRDRRPVWMRLRTPGGRRTVVRTNAEGRPARLGGYVTIKRAGPSELDED